MKTTQLGPLLLVSALFTSAFFLCALPAISYAEDGSYHLKSVFIGGVSSSGKSSYKITESNGTELGTSGDTANRSALFAGELTYQSKFLLGAGLLIEGTRYSYATGGTSDGELGVYLMPRLALPFGIFELWAGVGVGFMSTTLGGSNTATQDGVTLILNSTNATSFAWTPRAGIDINLNQRLFIGAQFSYTRTTFSVPFTAISGPNSITGSDDCTRSWIGGALRFGSRL